MLLFLLTCPVNEVSTYTCTCHFHLTASCHHLHELIQDLPRPSPHLRGPHEPFVLDQDLLTWTRTSCGVHVNVFRS